MKENDYIDWSDLKTVSLSGESFCRKDEVGKKLTELYKTQRQKEKYIRLTIRLVASFFLLCLGSAATYQFSGQTLLTDGGKERFELPDGSSVVLKPYSRLSYNRILWLFDRKMYLEGSGTFSIVKGVPCSVLTPKLTVNVLGTVFEITEDGNTTDVSCIEGSVQVQNDLVSKNLHPDETIRVKESGYDFFTDKTEILDSESILHTPLLFDSAPLSEVIKDLNTHFKCEIIANSAHKNYLFSGIIPDQSLEQTLIILSECLGLKYRIDGKRIYLFE